MAKWWNGLRLRPARNSSRQYRERQIISINPVSGVKRTLAYANGDFSPFHKYEATFEMLTLPDGRQFPIKTTVSMGTGEVVHLVSNPDKAKQKSAAGRAADSAKQEAKGKVQEAKEQAHDTWQKMTAPGRMHRFKQFLVSQSPYRRQYLEPGTRFVADLDAPLDFGETTRTADSSPLWEARRCPTAPSKRGWLPKSAQRLPRAAPRSRPFLPSRSIRQRTS